eukprot:sb/3472093/
MLLRYIKKRHAAKKASKHSKLIDREIRCSPSRRTNYLFLTGNGHLKLFVQLLRLLDDKKYEAEKVLAEGEVGDAVTPTLVGHSREEVIATPRGEGDQLIEWRRREMPAIWEEEVEWNMAKLRLVAMPCDSGNSLADILKLFNPLLPIYSRTPIYRAPIYRKPRFTGRVNFPR